MKKNVLALSIAAMIGGLGFAGTASAGVAFTDGTTANDMEVTANGVGHILLVPYFTTQNGNVSLLNIVNTDTTNGKLVKLRYRGASNSDDIYDITLMLSPGDMWSANVSQKNGVSSLTTNDTSCTLPAQVNADFSTERVLNKAPGETLEGYVEILNMGDIAPGKSDLYVATKHVNGVAPCTATTLQTLKTDFADAAAANTFGVTNPTGGLMANWSIVNLSKAGSFTGEATAISAITAPGVPGKANIVTSPQEDEALIPQAMADALTADPLLTGPTPKVTPKNYDFPDLSTPYTTGASTAIAQATRLGDALATRSVTNEYMTSPSVSFATDWTFSMPSRRYNVAVDYSGTTPTAVYNSGATYFTTANTTMVGSQLCVKSTSAQLAYFNTEEGVKSPGGFVISPQPAGASLAFCGEASVLAFNLANFAPATTPTGVLGAMVARQNLRTMKNATEFYTDGWMSLQTPGNGSLGLPVIGHAFAKALGTSASLGGIWKHRTSLVNP